jgi:DNA-binding CsgD family transcriptional regulator
MPRVIPPRLHERLLVRPGRWAASSAELPAALACAALLVLVFLGEISTGSSITVGSLALLPLVISAWMLSRWSARSMLALSLLLVIVEVAIKAIDPLTGSAEVIAFGTAWALVRLYASRFELLLPRQARPALDRILQPLSRREREIVRLTIDGHTAPEIAGLLHLSDRTVESHLASAYTKLGVRSKLELVTRAATSKLDGLQRAM